MNRLIVVSNRVGPLSDEGKAGGLAVGLADALRARGGVWFGWSGKTSSEGTFGPLHSAHEGEVQIATIDLSETELEEFYSGHANQTLWPILHYRIDLAVFERRFACAYQRVNERMGERLQPLLRPDDVVWVHDYHFMPLGARIRAGGFAGALGFFLHVPFPAPEIVSALPDARVLARDMLAYDVVGFQTETDRDNFRRFAAIELGATLSESGQIESDGRRTQTGVFPIGIDADRFAAFATSSEATRRLTQIRTTMRDRPLIIGVDRLDYSKGIPGRLKAFERLLTDYPQTCERAALLQIAPLSRAELETYAELRRELETLVGHINGQFGTLDWNPVRLMTMDSPARASPGFTAPAASGSSLPCATA